MPYCFTHWQINGLVPLSKNRRILIIVATFLSVWKVHLLLVLESLWREIPEFWPRVPGPLPGERIARHVSWRARQLHAVSTFTCAVLHSACLAVCRVSAFSCGHYITTGRERIARHVSWRASIYFNPAQKSVLVDPCAPFLSLSVLKVNILVFALKWIPLLFPPRNRTKMLSVYIFRSFLSWGIVNVTYEFLSRKLAVSWPASDGQNSDCPV